MSKEIIEAYYEVKDRLYHSMTCGIPSYDCNCGVDKFRNAIAALQEELAKPVQVPAGIYYSAEHQNFYDAETNKGQGLEFWNAWRQYAKWFPTR